MKAKSAKASRNERLFRFLAVKELGPKYSQNQPPCLLLLTLFLHAASTYVFSVVDERLAGGSQVLTLGAMNLYITLTDHLNRSVVHSKAVYMH